MRTPRIYVADLEDFKQTREGLTHDILGLSLLPKEHTAVKVVVTQVAPNGEFLSHIDEYHHVFYFISGNGSGHVGDRSYDITPMTIVEVPAGVAHGYKNTGPEPMQLITVNIPVS